MEARLLHRKLSYAGLCSQAEPAESTSAAARQIDVVCGLVILVCLSSAYTCTYGRIIGHAQPLSVCVNLSYLSLQSFFAIAAYQLVREVSGHRDWARYTIARLMRFVPAVVPAVLVAYVLVTQASIPQLHANATALLANLLLAADFFGMPDFDGAFWRLKIEVMFAAAFGIAWFGLGARWAMGMLVAGLALCALQAHGDPVRQTRISPAGLLTMDGYLPHLTIGIAAFHLAAGRHRGLWWLLAVVSGLIVMASNTLEHGLAVLVAYGVVGAAAHGALPMLAPLGWLAAIGRAFFSIYLLHQALGFVVIHWLEAQGVPPLPAVMAACGAAIVCGVTMHRYSTQTAQQFYQRSFHCFWVEKAKPLYQPAFGLEQ